MKYLTEDQQSRLKLTSKLPIPILLLKCPVLPFKLDLRLLDLRISRNLIPRRSKMMELLRRNLLKLPQPLYQQDHQIQWISHKRNISLERNENDFCIS
jgi:hypothetical protein